jgi:hypothetical protein
MRRTISVSLDVALVVSATAADRALAPARDPARPQGGRRAGFE